MPGVSIRSSPSGEGDAGADLGPDLGRRRISCHRNSDCPDSFGAWTRYRAPPSFVWVRAMELGWPRSDCCWRRVGSLGYRRVLETGRRYPSPCRAAETARTRWSLRLHSKSIVPWAILDPVRRVDRPRLSRHPGGLGRTDSLRSVRFAPAGGAPSRGEARACIRSIFIESQTLGPVAAITSARLIAENTVRRVSRIGHPGCER